MSELDMNTWERRDAYQYFSSFSNPFYMVSFRLDVTGQSWRRALS